jgi:hypothetical protein
MGDSEQSTADEQSNDLSAARSAGVEASVVSGLIDACSQHAIAAGRNQTKATSRETRNASSYAYVMWRSAATYLQKALEAIEEAGAAEVGTEAADAG